MEEVRQDDSSRCRGKLAKKEMSTLVVRSEVVVSRCFGGVRAFLIFSFCQRGSLRLFLREGTLTPDSQVFGDVGLMELVESSVSVRGRSQTLCLGLRVAPGFISCDGFSPSLWSRSMSVWMELPRLMDTCSYQAT